MDLKRLTPDSKARIRTATYLMQYNKDLLNKLKSYETLIGAWLQNKGNLSKNEYFEALKYMGVKYNRILYEQLFWIFDIKNDGLIDKEEFILISNLFKENTIEEKVKTFWDRVDTECEGFVDYSKLVYILFLYRFIYLFIYLSRNWYLKEIWVIIRQSLVLMILN